MTLAPEIAVTPPDATLRGLAERIAADQTDLGFTAELATGLAGARDYLREIIAGETSWPSRVDWHARLNALRCAAELIARELADPRMITVLEASDRGVARDVPSLLRLCEDAGRLAELAGVKNDAVPSGSGAHIFKPNPEGLMSHELCAAAIVAAWQWARKSMPGHTSKDAHAACQALWDAAGGTARGGWGNSRSGWRQHLEVAKSDSAKKARQLFDEFLLGARTACYLNRLL